MSANFEHDPEFNAPSSKPSKQRGFGLGKAFLVLCIILLLAALLLPATRSARPAARRAQCTNNLKQIGLALHNYEEAYNALPPAYTVDAQGRPLHSWRTLILPYLDQEALFRTIDLAKPWNDPVNAMAYETEVSVFRCPEFVGHGNTTTYLATTAPEGCLVPGRPRPLKEITDPHNSTLVVIEMGEGNAIPWMAPIDADEPRVMILGPNTKVHHAGGTNACFVDGSVRFLKLSIPAKVRQALISISGNEKLSGDEW